MSFLSPYMPGSSPSMPGVGSIPYTPMPNSQPQTMNMQHLLGPGGTYNPMLGPGGTQQLIGPGGTQQHNLGPGGTQQPQSPYSETDSYPTAPPQQATFQHLLGPGGTYNPNIGPGGQHMLGPGGTEQYQMQPQYTFNPYMMSPEHMQTSNQMQLGPQQMDFNNPYFMQMMQRLFGG